MENIDLKSMPIEQLWALHEEIAAILLTRLEAQKSKVENRLEQLGRRPLDRRSKRRPKAYPRFRNPESPHQTWSGRGLQPGWMRILLALGKSLDDLRIPTVR